MGNKKFEAITAGRACFHFKQDKVNNLEKNPKTNICVTFVTLFFALYHFLQPSFDTIWCPKNLSYGTHRT
ncbi:MAG: hypothetical protein JWM28_4377 [Chitinophagaceae bacterium]|nr:hypothetical protein [Chitinophagaceae bacterium]